MGASSMAGMGLAASLQAGIRTTGPAQESSFSGQEAQACRSLRELRLVDRTDPATLLVAKRIMNLRSRASVIPTRLREAFSRHVPGIYRNSHCPRQR
jgi:hypothetical protein